MIFFDEKKVEKKIGSSYRCKILWRIDFSHSRSDLATPLTANVSEDSLQKCLFFLHGIDNPRISSAQPRGAIHLENDSGPSR